MQEEQRTVEVIFKKNSCLVHLFLSAFKIELKSVINMRPPANNFLSVSIPTLLDFLNNIFTSAAKLF